MVSRPVIIIFVNICKFIHSPRISALLEEIAEFEKTQLSGAPQVMLLRRIVGNACMAGQTDRQEAGADQPGRGRERTAVGV